MPQPSVSPQSRRVVQRSGEIRRAIGTEIRRLREDAGVSLWVDIGSSGDRLLERPPRGVSVGR